MFRTIKRLFILTFVVVVAAAAWVRDSPYWTLVEINHGMQSKDVARIERVVDLEKFVSSSTQTLGTIFAEEVGGGGSDAGGKMLGALAGAFAKGLGDAMAKQGAKAFRQAVVDGRVDRKVGPLQVNEGFEAVGGMHKTIDGAVVEVKGTCDGTAASVWLQMDRREDGPFGGYPRRWVVVGIDPDSVKDLAAHCRAAPDAVKAKR